MATVQLSCPHCTQGSSIDTDRLPDQPVTLACPSCGGQITLDKSSLLAQQAASDPPPSAAPPPPAAGPSGPGPAEALLPPGFEMPEGVKLPSGILIGDDVLAMGTLSQTLERYGSRLRPIASAADARRLVDVPPLLVYVTGVVDGHPFAPIEPLITMPARDRRKTFLMLVADNLETLNGNDAFLYQVNLILNKAHLSAAAELLHLGLDFHDRMYGHLVATSQS